MHNFEFLDKGLRIVSPPHYICVLQKKCFSCYILWIDFIVWLLKILDNICVAILCFPICDVINLNLTVLSNQAVFLYEQKVKTKI